LESLIIKMKVAIAHEFLTQFGGAERVLLALNEIYPDAPIYVLVRKDFKQDNYFKNLNIHTSSLQKWFNLLGKRQKLLLSFYPYAIEQFNFSEFDLGEIKKDDKVQIEFRVGDKGDSIYDTAALIDDVRLEFN